MLNCDLSVICDRIRWTYRNFSRGHLKVVVCWCSQILMSLNLMRNPSLRTSRCCMIYSPTCQASSSRCETMSVTSLCLTALPFVEILLTVSVTNLQVSNYVSNGFQTICWCCPLYCKMFNEVKWYFSWNADKILSLFIFFSFSYKFFYKLAEIFLTFSEVFLIKSKCIFGTEHI